MGTKWACPDDASPKMIQHAPTIKTAQQKKFMDQKYQQQPTNSGEILRLPSIFFPQKISTMCFLLEGRGLRSTDFLPRFDVSSRFLTDFRRMRWSRWPKGLGISDLMVDVEGSRTVVSREKKSWMSPILDVSTEAIPIF